MEVGQRVYVRKNELMPPGWYEARVIEKRPAKRPVSLLCCSTVPLEYVVRYADATTQVVSIGRIKLPPTTTAAINLISFTVDFW